MDHSSEGIKTVKTSFIFRELSQKNSNYKSNNYFSIVNFDVKQFCVQLQKLFRNKRLRHGKNLRTSLC